MKAQTEKHGRWAKTTEILGADVRIKAMREGPSGASPAGEGMFQSRTSRRNRPSSQLSI